MILQIPGPLGPAQSRWVEERSGFSGPTGQAEQEISPGVEPGRSGPLQIGYESVELERSAGLLKGAALRLEMVDLRVVPLDAAAERMFAFNPAHVGAGHELLIAEQERVGRLGIA